MTNQEAIRLLKIERDHMTPTILIQRVEVMDMAISALEKQIPKKPKMPLDAYWVCPTCGSKVEHPFEHCRVCGQKICWEEER